LSGGEADFFYGQQAVVVKDVAMDQCEFLAFYSSEKYSDEGPAIGDGSFANVEARPLELVSFG
jgi:hypothetical protein